MRFSHTSFFVAAVLFIISILVGSIGLATPARALTITFPEKGFPKVEAGTVLGETSLGRPDSTNTTKSMNSPVSTNVRPTSSEQQNESTKVKKQENLEKEQVQKLQRLLQTTEPAELELKKNPSDQNTTVSLFELEKRKETSGNGEKSKFEKRETSTSQESWQLKAGFPTKAEERVNTVGVKLGKDLEVKSTQGGFDIRSSEGKASTTLPVQINTSTKELSVMTPNGAKVVKTLPDEAVAAIENSGFNGQVVGDVALEMQGDELVYKVRKEQNKKMFGFMPVTIRQDVQVSATTGEVTASQQSMTDRIFNFFSF